MNLSKLIVSLMLFMFAVTIMGCQGAYSKEPGRGLGKSGTLQLRPTGTGWYLPLHEDQ